MSIMTYVFSLVHFRYEVTTIMAFVFLTVHVRHGGGGIPRLHQWHCTRRTLPSTGNPLTNRPDSKKILKLIFKPC